MCRSFVAAAYLNVQLIILGCIVARAAVEPPSFFGFRLGWDETGQRVTVLQQSEGGSKRSVWNVLVARINFIIAWDKEVYRMRIAMPPLLVASVSASSIFNGLFLHVISARIWRALNFLIQRAQFVVSL